MIGRKKLNLVLIAILAVFAVSGCGSDAKVIEGDVQTKGTGKAAAAAESGAESGTEESSAQSQEAAVEYKGYAYIYQDVVIEIDVEAAPIVEQLGEANFYFEAPSCAFEGIDKMYTYNSFELDTYPMNDKDYISRVIFKDDTITTVEGVGIGDSAAKVEEAYGSGWTEEDGMRVYEKDGMKLCFILEEDNVVSVEYRSTVMDE